MRDSEPRIAYRDAVPALISAVADPTDTSQWSFSKIDAAVING